MRARSVLFVSVLSLAAGCGGKVVFEGVGSGGSGGAGGSNPTGPTTSSTSGTTTNPNVLCSDVSCSGGSDGSCDCQGVCNQQKLEVDCQPSGGAFFCACVENGIGIAKCQQGGGSCDVQGSCCDQYFFPPQD